MPRYNLYAPIDKTVLNKNVTNKPIIEKLENTTPSTPQCPAGSIYDTVNEKISTSKPCHCVNPDGSYSRKWIHLDGAC